MGLLSVLQFAPFNRGSHSSLLTLLLRNDDSILVIKQWMSSFLRGCEGVVGKANDRIPWGILARALQGYGVPELFLQDIWSLFRQNQSCVHFLRVKHVLSGCWCWPGLSLAQIMIFMDGISRLGQGEEENPVWRPQITLFLCR